MSTAARIGVFAAALVAIFGIAVGVGRAVGPIDEPEPEHDAGHGGTADADETTHGGHGGAGDDAASATSTDEVPGGLMVSQSGYTFALARTEAPAGDDVPVEFAITGPDGEAVTGFDVEHEKRLHLIAVRRDHTGFQHVHPELAADGTWSTTLDLTPGPWRLFADFKATGADPLTLGTDLAVGGDYRPSRVTPVSRTATVDDYTVELTGGLTPGRDSRLTLTVSKDGEPVTDLQPYLGAYGHLVALREGDLAYLHVHPDGTPGDGATEPGPDVVFYASVPSAGRYRLYLDFQHDGVVRTAAFTLAAGDDGGAAPAPEHAEDNGGGHSGHSH
jgi:hypothetical protein